MVCGSWFACARMSLCCLYEHVVLRVGPHFFCHVGVADAAFCRGRVLCGGAVRCCGSARGGCCL